MKSEKEKAKEIILEYLKILDFGYYETMSHTSPEMIRAKSCAEKCVKEVITTLEDEGIRIGQFFWEIVLLEIDRF